VRNYGIFLIERLIQMFKVLFGLFVTISFSCARKTEYRLQQDISNQWQYLQLVFNDTVIQLVKSVNTLEIKTLKEGLREYQINESERDSLFKEANELVDSKTQPKRFCTDYVGELKIWIRYNSQVEKQVTFNSICDWRELNANTTTIDMLLKKIFRRNG